MLYQSSNRYIQTESSIGRYAGLAFITIIITLNGAAQSASLNTAADKIRAAGRLRNPAMRLEMVEEIRKGENERLKSARERARQRGLPLRIERPGGNLSELIDFRNGRPLYRTTHNANAAISTGSNILRSAPFNADGSGMTVGIWDAGSVLTNHMELTGRVTSIDNAVTNDHSTHVGGTLAATGFLTDAKGMAPLARIDSYDWFYDTSEMTGRGASYPGEPDKLNISNHSYGIYAGWVGPFTTSSPRWVWYGEGSNAAGREPYFGMYASETRTIDSMAYALPYYLTFWSAGNDRNDNPVANDTISLFSGGPVVSYDAALHPPGDGTYFNGYDGLCTEGVAKNVITVGSVTDAVFSGIRSPILATSSSFSCYGPTDDGRIKPDLVANGEYLKSTVAKTPSSYETYSGTSMASPNAAGTALQLMHWFGKLFPGHTMRASTLKALLIHTATDRGNAGPDYQYGWGLVDGVKAGELLQSYQTNPGTQSVIEDRLTDTRTEVSFSFQWDGSSPIRATLCWTDPPGASTTVSDLRTPRLINNLDLRIIGPESITYEPWVMPFIDSWTAVSCAAAAVTGSNKTDNVEQVLITTPATPGIYTARVSYAGTLMDASQCFSLILSGAAASNQAPAPVLTGSSPLTGSGELLFSLTGDHFLTGASVNLRRRNGASVAGANIELQGDLLETRINTTGLDYGWWDMEIINPDGNRSVLYNAFVVPVPLWSEDFETNNIVAKGWVLTAADGANQWAINTSKWVSPTRCMHSPGAASRSDTALESPPLAIAAVTSGLQLSFQHDFSFESNDGGVLELSLDGGSWFDVTATGSGATFAVNGYNALIGNNGGNPPCREIRVVRQ